MSPYKRTVRGAEAGAIAAATLEISFFVLDLIQLHPLATPVALSGVVPLSGGFVLDLTSLSGVVAALWVVYQILVLTFVHFLMFGLVGIAASLLFDWRQPFEARRVLILAALCTAAFFVTVVMTSSWVALESVGWGAVLGTNVLAAIALGGSLRWVSKGGMPGDVAA